MINLKCLECAYWVPYDENPDWVIYHLSAFTTNTTKWECYFNIESAPLEPCGEFETRENYINEVRKKMAT